MSEVTYRYRPNFSFGGVPAQMAGKELARIQERDQGVRARKTVEAARPDDAPLHPGFEWNDEKAGEAYRLVQARSLIRAIFRVTGDDPEPRRVYVHVRAEEQAEGVYQPLVTVVADDELFTRALTELQRRLDGAQKAFDELRRAAETGPQATHQTALAIAAQGFGAVQEALRLLR